MPVLRCLSCLLFLVFLSAPAMAADSVNLVGKWGTSVVGHDSKRGFFSSEGKGEMIVLEQKDGAFYGKKVSTRDGRQREESFSGVISLDGKRFFIAEHEDGFSEGEILGPDEMVLYYLESGQGSSAKAMRQRLARKK